MIPRVQFNPGKWIKEHHERKATPGISRAGLRYYRWHDTNPTSDVRKETGKSKSSNDYVPRAFEIDMPPSIKAQSQPPKERTQPTRMPNPRTHSEDPICHDLIPAHPWYGLNDKKDSRAPPWKDTEDGGSDSRGRSVERNQTRGMRKGKTYREMLTDMLKVQDDRDCWKELGTMSHEAKVWLEVYQSHLERHKNDTAKLTTGCLRLFRRIYYHTKRTVEFALSKGQ
jgi:hypothetical protein